jgi:hypothetical protein
MNTILSSLSYEFYYLLRTEIEQHHPFWREPPSLSMVPSPSLTETGILIDNDKRLFRYSVLSTVTENEEEPSPLENWLEQLKIGWNQIQRCYSQHFANQSISEVQTQAFCHQALLGVALLINDTHLESHTVMVPFKEPDDSVATQVVFKPDTWLLQITHTPFENSDSEHKSIPALLAKFEAQFQVIPQSKHWQIQLEATIPYLAPMKISQDTANPELGPNPIFSVYGLAYGDFQSDDTESWPQALQDFLVNNEPAVLVRTLPRLLLREWQLTRMDLAVLMVRQYLQKSSTHYHKQVKLPCLSARKLSYGLQTMAEVAADTSLLLGQLQQAIETLEIHRHNLEYRLQRARRYRSDWHVLWQYEEEAPILDHFQADQQKLHNHITYLNSELTYLEGIRQRWHLHFEGQQLAQTEQLGSLARILAFLVAIGIASLTAVSLSYPQPTDNGSFLSPIVHFFYTLQTEPIIADIIMLLKQPMVYWLLILIILWPIVWGWGKTFVRKIRCSWLWRWGIIITCLSPAIWYLGDVMIKLLNFQS